MPHSYALFTPRFNPETGAVERFTECMAKELASRGNVVTVVTSDLGAGIGFELFGDRVQVLRLPSHSFMDGKLPTLHRGIRHNAQTALLRRCAVDRVLVNEPFYSLSLYGLNFAEQINAPAIMLDHGAEHLPCSNTGSLNVAIRQYERIIATQAQHYKPLHCATSDYGAKRLQRQGFDDVRIIPNAIDARAFASSASNRDFRKEYEIGNGFLAAYVGDTSSSNGLGLVLWAQSQFASDGLHCVVAGEGLQNKALAEGNPRNAHVTGELSAPDRAALLKQADVLVLPSAVEDFPPALLEAAACGTPAVVADVGGAREVTDAGRNGFMASDQSPQAFLSALCDAISAGSDYRQKVGAAARKRVEQCYTWASSADQLEHLFDEMEQGSL